MQAIWFNFLLWLMNFMSKFFFIVIINKISIQHMWIFVYTIINEFYLLCQIFYFLSYVPKIFYWLFFLYCTWQIKHIYFFGEKLSSSLRNDKFLFGMLYINLLNLVWFWSRIWGFYKFWSFKSWHFWYLPLNRLILTLHLKCFLFMVTWFFVFLLKAMIFDWLIICLDST